MSINKASFPPRIEYGVTFLRGNDVAWGRELCVLPGELVGWMAYGERNV